MRRWPRVKVDPGNGCRWSEAVPLDQPGGIVGLAEVEQCQPQLLDRFEASVGGHEVAGKLAEAHVAMACRTGEDVSAVGSHDALPPRPMVHACLMSGWKLW